MADLSQYQLSDSFKGSIGYPKVGEIIRGKQLLAVWVNKFNALRGYKLKCGNCGEISEFVHVQKVKNGTSVTCRYCHRTSALLSTLWFKQNYNAKIARNLVILYNKREEQSGRKFHELWKTDYKAFAEYIVALENFDKYPEYQTDRIDNNRGYEPGNIRFVTKQDNMNNRSCTTFIEFKDAKYPFADFIRLIVGEDIDRKIYRFVTHRIRIKLRPLNKVLRELYDNPTIWSNNVMETHYCNWYESQFPSEAPRKYCKRH